MKGTEGQPGAYAVTGKIEPISLSDPAGSSPGDSRGLTFARRLVVFVLLFAAEWIPLTRLVHKGRGAGILFQVAVAFCSMLLAVAYVKDREAFRRISLESRGVPIRWGLLALHAAALAAFCGLSVLAPQGNLSGYAVGALWYAAGFLAMALAAWALIPPESAWELIRPTGYAWIYALAAAAVAARAVILSPAWNGAWDPALWFSWKPAGDLTFSLVHLFLQPFLSQVVADRTTMAIGSPQFNIRILPWCAGFEGVVLMLVFSVAWLAYFRREFRFPQALLMVPAGMLVIWLSNAVRITLLILIGASGAPEIAMGGFHSQAGWIAFNGVALGFVVLTRRMPWVAAGSAAQAETERDGAWANATALYLMPFLAILAAAMISRAVSSGFEWLYPLRFFSAAGVLWLYRSKYAELNWRFSGWAVVAGAVVFAMWLILERASGPQASGGLGVALAALPSAARICWLVFRTAAAVGTVPVAEELAFRGFLIRRLMAADFEAISPRRYTYVAVGLSSLAFGLLHGERWVAGSLAGLIYAAVFLRRGRIGDAVAAHATTNALLAAWVLAGGRWYLW